MDIRKSVVCRKNDGKLFHLRWTRLLLLYIVYMCVTVQTLKIQWNLSIAVTRHGTCIFGHYRQVAALSRLFYAGLAQLGPAVQ